MASVPVVLASLALIALAAVYFSRLEQRSFVARAGVLLMVAGAAFNAFDTAVVGVALEGVGACLLLVTVVRDLAREGSR